MPIYAVKMSRLAMCALQTRVRAAQKYRLAQHVAQKRQAAGQTLALAMLAALLLAPALSNLNPAVAARPKLELALSMLAIYAQRMLLHVSLIYQAILLALALSTSSQDCPLVSDMRTAMRFLLLYGELLYRI